MARKVVRPAYEERVYSVDLFDGDRKNDDGGMWCVAPAILERDVEWYWDRYTRPIGGAGGAVHRSRGGKR